MNAWTAHGDEQVLVPSSLRSSSRLPAVHTAVAGVALLLASLSNRAGDLAGTLSAPVRMEVPVAVGDPVRFTVDLPPGTAADVELVQRSGFVDLELMGTDGPDLTLRTETGLGGRAESVLLATTARHWLIVLSTRRGNGDSSATLSLSPLRPATPRDVQRSAGFEHYVDAERLRFMNFKETRTTARSATVERQTRREYAAATAEYGAAEDGCGVRRARTGLARLEVALGNFAPARAAATSALEATCNSDSADRAQALKTLGIAEAYLGNLAASAAAAEEAVTIYRQTGDLRYQGVVLGNLSDVYMQLGETDRALTAANGALQAAEDSKDEFGVVFCRESIAAIHLARGELADALGDYRSTLQELPGAPYPMIEGETWNDLGILYHRMGDYSQSLTAYAAAQRVWKQMNNHLGHADTLLNQGQALLESSDTPGAQDAFSAALSIARADGLKNIETGALRSLGKVMLKRADLRSARRDFAASLALARGIGASAAASYALRDIADLDDQEGRPAVARREAESALRLAREASDRDGEAATLEQLARLRADAGDLMPARALIERALAIIETQRGQINDPSLRTTYFAAMRAYPDTQVRILMQLDARFPNHGFTEAALAAAERARARSLQDMLTGKAIDVSRTLAPGLAQEQNAAEERLNAAAVSFGRLSPKASDERRRTLADGVDAANRSLDEVRGRIRASDPRYADLVRPANVNVADLQRSLPDEHTGILEYWLGARESYLWIVQRHALRVVRLAPRARIEQLSLALQNLCNSMPDSASAAGFDAYAKSQSTRNEDIRRAAAALAQAVLPPDVRSALPLRLIIVPDASLQDVAFGLLPDGPTGELLGTTRDLSYLPSISTLQWIRRPDGGREVRREAVAVVAAPVLPATGFAPLPYARSEAEGIAALLPKDRVWLALGAQASREAVRSADWRQFTIAHFATHATVDRARPELSGIVLSAPPAGARDEDGVLRLNDIYNLDMPVNLVVLSGCETAAGRELDSEGVFSLSRAFLYAGATHVLASLWPVDDRATEQFMQAFYHALLVDHAPAATALRVAQRRLAGDARWASPYYWAAFVLQGDWS